MAEKNLNLQNLDLSLLETLSPAEQELALSILKEYAEKGESSSLNDILLEDYAEPPVDILTFVDDYKYLGNAWHDAQGNSKLYPYWRKELVKIFPDNLTTSVNNAIFSGSRGRGKEQPISSLVLSDKGFIRMGDVNLDTKVFGCDGKLHPVTGIYPQGVKDVYEITFSDGTTARCGLEHLWKVVDMDHMELHKNAPKEEVLTTECLLNRSLLSGRNRKFRYKIPVCKPIEFERKNTFISPYLMGCLLGDGCFSGKHYISITSADNLIIDIFKNELLKNNYKLSPKKCKNNKCIDFDILPINRGDKNKYVDEIKKLNLLGTYSDTKFIPDVYLYNDVESRTALLQGLLDTDGGLHKSKQRNGQISYSLEFSTTSAKLRDDVIWLVQSLGGTATYIRRASQYKDKHDIIKKCLDHYRIKIRLPEEIIPFKLDRKLIPYKNTAHVQPYRYIARIEKLDKKEECQCIMVGSEEHLYITDNFIVTHNTEIAVLIAAYLLHRVLCLKDPVAHFHLKPTEKLVFAFMNIKLDLAKEIGIAKFQNTIQSSPWFLERGTLEGRTKKMWVPKKFNDQEAIDIKIGSQADDLIGLPIYFCLDGDTEILTSNGVSKIKNLVDKQIKVPTISDDSNIVLSNICSVKQTTESNIEYEIKLEDNTIIKCTPNHRFRLVDGSYKEAQNLNEDDDILSFTPYGYIYKTTNLVNNKIYIGQHRGAYLDENYLGSGKLLAAAINKYGKESFKCELLELCADKMALDQKEKEYIKKYNSQNNEIGYNISEGGQGGDLGPVARSHISESLRGIPKSLEHRKKLSEANKGKRLPESQKEKISKGNKGKILSAETKEKMSVSAKKLSHHNYKTDKGKVVVTNGFEIKYIDKQSSLPEGYIYGNCKTAVSHNMTNYYNDEEAKKKKSESHKGIRNAMYGKGYLRSGGNNTNAHTRYFYKEYVFECRKDLVNFLKQNVDPKISINLIRCIEKGTYKKPTELKYSELIQLLRWETK